ncbi:cytosolic protein [Ornithinibacillus salinisoli]|uniref:Cytosolic protein n=1 Tax=Ornithinibacillus salinisoli TaxID=1848459 RepID=A0ABW4W4N0_9BACI
MAIRHKVSKYLNNHAETSETHWDPALQSKYYKTTKDKALAALESLFNSSQKYEINSISKEHGEISLHVKKGKKAFVVITVIMVRPYQTAIDFSVTTETLIPIDLGYSTKLIQQLYQQVNKELPLIDKK